MLTRKRKVLGVALEEDQILLAEVSCHSLRYRITRTGTFALGGQLSYEEPGRLGTELHQFLRKHHFGAREAVIGLPAKWLLVKESEVPAVAQESLANMARLIAEREFSLDINDLVLDYTCSDAVQGGAARRLLVTATLRRRMEQITTAVRTAGLKVLSVTSSSLVLCLSGPSSAGQGRHTLYLGGHYAEISTQNGAGFCALKYLSYAHADNQESAQAPASLIQQLDHYFALQSAPSDSAEKDVLVIWDSAGRGAEFHKSLEQNLGRPFDIRAGLEQMQQENQEGQEGSEVGFYAAPIYLGRAGLGVEDIALDFVNSKISPRKKASHKKSLWWSIGTAAAVLIAVLGLFWSWRQDKQEIARLAARLEENKEEIAAVESLSHRVSLVQNWYSDRPKILDCLYELTRAFPEQGTIWVTSLALREDMRGIITGKSVDEAVFLEVMDKLKENPVFTNVQMLYLRDTGRSSQDLAFAIDFIYTNGK